jgi:hypothetical protein
MFATNVISDEERDDGSPPFTLSLLEPVKPAKIEAFAGKGITVYNPRNPYNILINYELGMHCVGFDVSYCYVIPPYNSVQAQAVQSGLNGELPRLLSPNDKVKLHYSIKDKSYSEGNKMKYWQVPKDVSGDGTMSHPGDNMANYAWKHLFIYKDLEGTLTDNLEWAKRLHIGKEISVNIDSGPPGKNIADGYLDYAKEKWRQYRLYRFDNAGDRKCSTQAYIVMPVGRAGPSFDRIQRQHQERHNKDI